MYWEERNGKNKGITMTKSAKTKWAKSDKLPANIDAIIKKAVADALEQLDIDAMIRNAIAELDVVRIAREALADERAS